MITSPDDKVLLARLTSMLTPELLLDLASDLLYVRGHRNIRITDGPGDGARDVHSIDTKGTQFITQCKYHQDHNVSVRTREMAELPIALIKLGSNGGLFLTNGSITPQSKREYLNDYPGLELDFLDGPTLIRELRSSAVLSSRWLDATEAPWPYSVTFPVIVRRHEGDVPIIPSALYGEAQHDLISSFVNARHSTTDIVISSGFIVEDRFGAYREPTKLTHEEGFLPRVECTICRVSGLASVAALEKLDRDIAYGFSHALTPHEDRFSVLVGIPTFVPLAGENAGATLRLHENTYCLINTRDFIGAEQDFFELNHNKWTADSDARVSEASAIRLYAPSLDVCLAVTHRSPVSRLLARTNRAMRLYRLEKWNLSVFALSEMSTDSWYSGIPMPDEIIAWPWEDVWLCGWFHRDLLGGFIAPPSSNPERQAFFDQTEEGELRRLDELRSKIKQLAGLTLVDPPRARHMLAAISYDPFEEEGEILFDTATLSFEEGTLGPVSGYASDPDIGQGVS